MSPLWYTPQPMAGHLKWTAHPARQRPRELVLVLSVLLLTMGAVLSTFQSLFFALLAATILIAAVASFLFPTHYEISEWGIREQRLGRKRARPWNELRRLQLGDRGALLSPFARASWMDRYRGVTLLFDGVDRATVVANLQDRFAAASEPERT
jgi:hypothetical protein